MSFKGFIVKIVTHSRQILQTATQRQIKNKVVRGRFKQKEARKDDKGQYHQQKYQPGYIVPVPRSLICRITRNDYVNAFVNNLRRKWMLPNHVSQRLGQAAARAGVGAPAFMFLGLSLTANKTQDLSNDTLCQEIRGLFSKNDGIDKETGSVEYCLQNINFGEIINKGCDAAVYEAQLKTDCDDDGVVVLEDFKMADETSSVDERFSDEEMSISSDDSDESFVVIGEAEDIFEADTFNLDFVGSVADENDEDILILSEQWEVESSIKDTQQFDVDFKFSNISACDKENSGVNTDYDLAVKVMFNYGIESNSSEILRVMERELVPESSSQVVESPSLVSKKLPAHFNIVDVKGQFVDDMPKLSKSVEHFPEALPKRLHEHGLGRNKTMFLVMKRYPKTLREYLSESSPDMKTRITLLIQLLDSISHMLHHGIAHRDLKSNNILIDDSGDIPHLVVCDFGNCLADEIHGLRIPYQTSGINKGGNSALMSPEIKCAQAGLNSVLDYSKSDLWSAGTIAYEILGAENPFYQADSNRNILDSRTYNENQLPQLPDHVPNAVRNLVATMLRQNPRKRPSVGVALNILHMHLWGAPETKTENAESTSDIKLWLLVFVARFLMETCFQSSEKKMELQLKANMLRNIDLQNLSYAYHQII